MDLPVAGTMIGPNIGDASRLVVAIVFVVAGAMKVRDPARVIGALRALRLAPNAYRGRVPGYVLGASEIVLGCTLAFGFGGPFTIGGSVALLLAFSAVLVRLRQLAYTASCGCLGERDAATRIAGVCRNAVLIGLLLVSAATSNGGEHLRPAWGMEVSTLWLTLGGICVLMLVYAVGALLETILGERRDDPQEAIP